LPTHFHLASVGRCEFLRKPKVFGSETDELLSKTGLTILLLTLTIQVIRFDMATAQSQLYQFTTIAGLAGHPGSTDGTNSDARFNAPSGVALDGNGNVYVTDTGNSTIRRLAPVGTNWVSSTIAGLAGSVGSADGTNSDARFNQPFGITEGRGIGLSVTDQGNSTIRRLLPVYTDYGPGWVTTTISGLAGSPGSADGTNCDARFSFPSGIASTWGGDAYVADTGNGTIRRLTARTSRSKPIG
jgi:hypothetical protein